jgi:hypothetical protein
VSESIIKPKRPTGDGWRRATSWQPAPELAAMGYPVEAWAHRNGLFVLSAVEVTEVEPGSEELGPEYHISVSKMGQRCSSAEALWVLAQFDLVDATEDNHVPSGRVRNFWRPVADRLSGYTCPCQGNEPAIREDKGDYVWRGVTR